MSKSPFSIDVGNLRSRPKDSSPEAVERADEAGKQHGFVPREAQPARRGGRAPSPRTGQIHAKVLPHVSDAIAEEARRRGTQQGIIIEEAWKLYLAQRGET